MMTVRASPLSFRALRNESPSRPGIFMSQSMKSKSSASRRSSAFAASATETGS